MKKTPLTGDIFAFPVTGKKFGFGQVVLDPFAKNVPKKRFTKNNPLHITTTNILVNIFKDTSTKNDKIPENPQMLIPGILTGSGFIKSGIWPIVGNKKIKVEEIELPEFLAQKDSTSSYFYKGEIQIEVAVPFNFTDKLKIYPATYPGVVFGQLILVNTGKANELNLDEKVKSLRAKENIDIRFSPAKKEIYKHIDKKLIENYYEFAKEKGFDLKDFYTK